MRINWFKDENHLVYINGATQLAGGAAGGARRRHAGDVALHGYSL